MAANSIDRANAHIAEPYISIEIFYFQEPLIALTILDYLADQ